MTQPSSPLVRGAALLIAMVATTAQAGPATNAILVTADGLRWQEIFRGADQRLLDDKRYTPKDYVSFKSSATVGGAQARRELMPFFWEVVIANGTAIGDRDHGSHMRVENPWWFSYPGYNEILTGRVDPNIDSNEKLQNPNRTVLEWLNQEPSFRGKVQAFGSWDVFPFIINATRSGVPVNAGFDVAKNPPSERERWLGKLQGQIPSPWTSVRLDAFTHNFALETLRTDRARVVYIAYGETDDFAHDGEYGQYLDAIHRFDDFLRELWVTLQSDAHYKDRTVLLITTDHGRGEMPLEAWQHHSSRRAALGNKDLADYPDGIVGSDQIWFAALGPGIAANGVVATQGDRTQRQIAATLLKALGIDPQRFDAAAGAPLSEVFEQR